MQTEIKIEAVYPLLPTQQGLLVDSLAGESDVYQQQICVQLLTSVTTETLKENILKTVEHHDILHTIFDWSDGEPSRIVISGIEPSIQTLTTSAQRPLSALLTDEKASLKPVDQSPPIRFTIIDDGESHLLAITYHHILLDGPSVDILLQQIITGRIPESSPRLAYEEWFANSIGDAEHDTWKSILSSIDTQAGTLTNAPQHNSIRKHKQLLRPEIHTQIIEKAKMLHMTPAVYVQSVWSIWEKAFFNKDTLLYGLVVSTRTPGLTDNVLGPYITTIPWTVTNTTSNFDALVHQTNDQILEIQTAKHVPLGDIVKQTSPAAMSFDSILTIITRPVQDTTLYKIVATTENTGYPLSVDIELSANIIIIFSTTLEKMDNALQDFCRFFEAQVYSSLVIDEINHYTEVNRATSETLPHIKTSQLIDYVAEILYLETEEVPASINILEAGGDSISALKLKAKLQTAGYSVSVGDILKANSFEALTKKVYTVDPAPAMSLQQIPATTKRSIEAQYGQPIEYLSYIPPAAQTIVDYYRSGFGQDYHEQTAFRLTGTLGETAFTQAIQLLGKELATLRLIYPAKSPNVQVLLQKPRTQTTFTNVNSESFEEYVETLSSSDWAVPYDLETGPLIRISVAHSHSNESYLFMSFSALISDGWSFSIMLERLFNIYADLLNNISPIEIVDYYHTYSKLIAPAALIYDTSPQPSSGYVHDVTGENFIIEPRLTQIIVDKSKVSHLTLSATLLQALSTCLPESSFSQIKVYENGRDSAESTVSIGHYSYLSRQSFDSQGDKSAYYVFENYPKDSENRLKRGQVMGFDEHGSWRKDLLPPRVNVGFLFEFTGNTIDLRILVRGTEANQNTYWEKLLISLKSIVQDT